MLNISSNGGVDIYINNNFIGCATNPESAVFDTLETFYGYLSGNISSLEIVYEGEDYEFGLTEIASTIYSFGYYTDGTMSKPELSSVRCENNSPYAFIRNLSKEVISDIESNFDNWVNVCCEDSDDFYRSTTKEDLEKLILELTPYLNGHEMEIGNLLFGNSRGNFPLQREGFEEEFNRLISLGFDSYGHADDFLEKYMKRIDGKTSHVHVFDNGTFMINPYYWGEDEELMKLPNFVYYPDNLEINWYKYYFRDSYVNKPITLEYFKEVVDRCIESIKENIPCTGS